MDYGIENTATGLSALNQQYQAISNNLANVNTAGYKRELAIFHQVLASQMAGQGGSSYASVAAEMPAAASGGPAAPPGVGSQVHIDFSQGEVSQTGRKLDVALAGKGFLVVETPEGPRYTRNGQLQIHPVTGQLINLHGQSIAGEGGPITIPNNVSSENIQISADGTAGSGSQQLGKLRIVEFDDLKKMIPIGNGLFVAPDDQTPVAAGKTKVLQGYQESSNVRMVEELVSLIMATRLYEANAKSITQMDERLKNLLSVSL
ncbi:MAG: flagellar hook-basal body protein [Planctomycetes bacterium]|nr:flagellar hook-basal body protein [Planctomycetota bacterium]